MDERCKCGEVEIPHDWRGVTTVGKVHYFDRCADVIVYDEISDVSPEVWAVLSDSAGERQ